MRGFGRLIVIIALLAVTLQAMSPPASAAESAPTWPSTNLSFPWATDGQTIAWLSRGSSADLYTINVQDLVTGSTQTVAEDICDLPLLSIDGRTLVWVARRCDNRTIQDLFVLNFDSMDLQRIEDVKADVAHISGNWIVADVVSLDVGTGVVTSTFQARALSDLQHPVTVASVDVPVSTYEFSNGRIVWDESSESNWTLRMVTIDSPSPVTLADGERSDLFSFDVYGDVVAYTDQWTLHAVNLATEATTDIPGRAKYPTTNGRFVFWEDTRFIDEGTDTNQSRSDIWAYDLATGSTFPVTSPPQSGYTPISRGNLLRWFGVGVGTVAVRIHSIVPSAPQPDPNKTSSDWLYFSATGHYLSFGFRDFWQASGGLAIFGYPQTEEFSQNGHTVQYLERQRFEYHPEFAGTPYETELGLLGTEAASSAGLLETAPFAALPADTGTDANCDFIAATGHRLCGEFRQYWQSHGLDFGDTGNSYRESLALFGNPISEEFTDPTSGLTVQYFERAVFEFHFDNPAPYRVELRLLGSSRLQSFDW